MAKLKSMNECELAMLGFIKGKETKECCICGTPTPFIDICSETHFCSKECCDNFYEMMAQEEKQEENWWNESCFC